MNVRSMVHAIETRVEVLVCVSVTLLNDECCCAEPARYLELHIKDLAAREKAIHCQLAALSEDAADDFL